MTPRKPLTSPAPTLDLRAAAVLTLCCLIWGISTVMVKVATAGLSPILNAALRSILAAVVLLIWARWRGVDVFGRDGTLWAGIAAGLIFSLEFVTMYVGLASTTASRGTVFIHCAPFVAAAGEHFLVPGHRLTGLRLLGLVAAFAGLMLALAEPLTSGAGSGSITGDLLCLAGGVFWGSLTVLAKTTRFGACAPEKAVLYQLSVSAVVLTAAAPLLETVRMDWTVSVAGAFIFTVFLTVAFGYTVWFWLMSRYSAASLHAFTFLTPIFGVIGGVVILGERAGGLTIAGLALVALGIYLVNRPARALKTPKAHPIENAQ
jgi:drug/metabolite transporter (DMT)-like permease